MGVGRDPRTCQCTLIRLLVNNDEPTDLATERLVPLSFTVDLVPKPSETSTQDLASGHMQKEGMLEHNKYVSLV